VRRPRQQGCRAAFGNRHDLAGKNQIGVLELGIRLGDAGPGVAIAEVYLRQFPEGVTALDDDLLLGITMRRFIRQSHQHSHRKPHGIFHLRIARSQYLPILAGPQIFARKLPKCVAGLDANLCVPGNFLVRRPA